MPPLEPPEKSGNQVSYPKAGSFADLLKWHLDFGTRPTGSPDRPGKRWGNKEFAGVVRAKTTVAGEEPDRVVRNWRAGRNRPSDLGSIERALFGDNPAYDQWRFDLRAAYDGRQQPREVIGIPRPREPFLGRAKDVATILNVLLSSSAPLAILVQGGPGIGKTSLTQEVGHRPEIVRCFGEANRWFVALDTATTAEAMRDAITRALGGDPARSFEAMLKLLRRQPGLLVLDNLETPWDPQAERRATEDTLATLAAVPGLALLASFRGSDHVGGPAWALVHSVAHLRTTDSTDLFCQIAQWKFPEDPYLRRFIAALGGIPLAIRLVAARAHGRTSLAGLWAQWTRIGTALACDPDFDANHLTSLPHSIELSLRSSRLTAAAYRLFRLLGQLPAGIVAEDRDALLGDVGFDAEEALLRIGLAVERNNNRLDLLLPIRDHAARYHPLAEPDSTAWPAHYLVLTRQLGETIGTKAGEGAVSRLLPEFANIEAAIRTVLTAGRRLQAISALKGFSLLASIAALPAPVLADLAVRCRAEADLLGEANCLRSLGDVALERSDYAAARAAYEQALPLFRQVGSVLGQANCIFGLGTIAFRCFEHDAARDFFERALPLYRKVGSVLGEANCIFRLGVIAFARYENKAARAACRQALPLYRQIANVRGEADCIRRLGDTALMCSEREAARDFFKQALPLYRQIGDARGEAGCLRSLGVIALQRSEHEAARDLIEHALSLFRQIGNARGEASCFKSFGDLAFARSEHEAAHDLFEQARVLYHQVTDLWGEADCNFGFGEVAQARSEHEAARVFFKEAQVLYQRIRREAVEEKCRRRLDALKCDPPA